MLGRDPLPTSADCWKHFACFCYTRAPPASRCKSVLRSAFGVLLQPSYCHTPSGLQAPFPTRAGGMHLTGVPFLPALAFKLLFGSEAGFSPLTDFVGPGAGRGLFRQLLLDV